MGLFDFFLILGAIKAVVSSQLKLSAKCTHQQQAVCRELFTSLKLISLFSYILIAYQVSFPFVKAKVECNEERRGIDNQVNSANSDVSNQVFPWRYWHRNIVA